jgi:acyl-CoA synthetase (AMP-forming)/AMP-acid ligase II
MIHNSPLPDVQIPDLPVTEYVLGGVNGREHKPALIDGSSGRALGYAQLAAAIRSLASGLVATGFARGDVLALMVPNCPEYAVIFHAAAMAGGVVTPVNPACTEEEIHHQLVDSGARILVTIPLLASVGVRASAGTRIGQIYALGEAPGVPSLASLSGPPLAEQVPVAPDDVVALPYSSGTTGLPKGVMLTHRNLVANIAQTLGSGVIGPDDTLVAVMPFFHIYGLQVTLNCGLRAGATVVTLPRFDLGQFLQAHQDYRATRSFVVPPIMLALARHPLVDKYDLSALQLVGCGAAPLKPELADECGTRLSCEVGQGFGMTELSALSHVTPPGWYRPGSVGVTVPNTLTRIIDPATGEDLGVGEDGEICVRGPQVMKGYLGNAAATAATIDDDGWLHTGDLGHVDSAGHLHVVDRLKELIKYKGFQVPPAELEALLLQHPDVSDAAVVGLPDEEAGEIPAGYVTLRPGASTSTGQIQQFVAAQVAGYKQIRRLEVIEAIPRSPAGKILRRVLRDAALAQVASRG